MAIERKELKDIATTTRSAFQKAMGEVQKGNSDYALELLKGIVQRNPGFVDARAALREAEKRDLPYAREITLYLAHGLLHAAGYDDLQVNLKKKMRRAEKRVMTQIEQEFDLDSIFKLCREED